MFGRKYKILEKKMSYLSGEIVALWRGIPSHDLIQVFYNEQQRINKLEIKLGEFEKIETDFYKNVVIALNSKINEIINGIPPLIDREDGDPFYSIRGLKELDKESSMNNQRIRELESEVLYLKTELLSMSTRINEKGA